MVETKTNFGRVIRALHQRARILGVSEEDFRETVKKTEALLEKCGRFSRSRQMSIRIGTRMLDGRLKIIVPCCPDYSHEDECYTFEDLGGGVSLLTQKHIAFLKTMEEVYQDFEVTFLVANLESEDERIRGAVGKTKEEFDTLVSRSISATNRVVAGYGWGAAAMTEMIPDLKRRELEMGKWIKDTKEFNQRIISETIQRTDLYWKINRSIRNEEAFERTIRTAAQYVALGQFAHERGFLVVNHTTVNLSWYTQTQVAVLHNPTSVY